MVGGAAVALKRHLDKGAERQSKKERKRIAALYSGEARTAHHLHPELSEALLKVSHTCLTEEEVVTVLLQATVDLVGEELAWMDLGPSAHKGLRFVATKEGSEPVSLVLAERIAAFEVAETREVHAAAMVALRVEGGLGILVLGQHAHIHGGGSGLRRGRCLIAARHLCASTAMLLSFSFDA